MKDALLENVSSENDIVVAIDLNLKFDKHTQNHLNIFFL